MDTIAALHAVAKSASIRRVGASQRAMISALFLLVLLTNAIALFAQVHQSVPRTST